MYYQEDDLEKIKLFDKLFRALSLDDVKKLVEADIIVDKLKSAQHSEGPIAQAARELRDARSDIDMLKSDSMMLKSDIQTLVRCLSKGMGDSMVIGDFNNLKMRHGVY